MTRFSYPVQKCLGGGGIRGRPFSVHIHGETLSAQAADNQFARISTSQQLASQEICRKGKNSGKTCFLPGRQNLTKPFVWQETFRLSQIVKTGVTGVCLHHLTQCVIVIHKANMFVRRVCQDVMIITSTQTIIPHEKQTCFRFPLAGAFFTLLFPDEDEWPSSHRCECFF